MRESLTLESKMSAVAEAAAKLRALCSSMGIAGGDVMLAEFCAVEAMGSAIAHGYGGKKGQPVEVVVTLEGGALTLEVRDHGRAVPAARAAKLDIPPSTMKTVSFASNHGVNTLTLTKKVRVL